MTTSIPSTNDHMTICIPSEITWPYATRDHMTTSIPSTRYHMTICIPSKRSHDHMHYINKRSHDNMHSINKRSHNHMHYIIKRSHDNMHSIKKRLHDHMHSINKRSHDHMNSSARDHMTISIPQTVAHKSTFLELLSSTSEKWMNDALNNDLWTHDTQSRYVVAFNYPQNYLLL